MIRVLSAFAKVKMPIMTQTPPSVSPDVAADAQQSQEHASRIRQGRIEKLAEWRQRGVNPYPYHFEKSHRHAELQEKYAALENGVETDDEVAVAGRVMALRNSGMFI